MTAFSVGHMSAKVNPYLQWACRDD